MIHRNYELVISQDEAGILEVPDHDLMERLVAIHLVATQDTKMHELCEFRSTMFFLKAKERSFSKISTVRSNKHFKASLFIQYSGDSVFLLSVNKIKFALPV